MQRPTTDIERSLDLIQAEVTRIKTSTIGVVTKERRERALKHLDDLYFHVEELERQLDDLFHL